MRVLLLVVLLVAFGCHHAQPDPKPEPESPPWGCPATTCDETGCYCWPDCPDGFVPVVWIDWDDRLFLCVPEGQ